METWQEFVDWYVQGTGRDDFYANGYRVVLTDHAGITAPPEVINGEELDWEKMVNDLDMQLAEKCYELSRAERGLTLERRRTETYSRKADKCCDALEHLREYIIEGLTGEEWPEELDMIDELLGEEVLHRG